MIFYRIKKIIKKILPEFLINYYHYFLAWLGALYFGFPSSKLIVIGITGTKGKTTVTELVNQFLEAYGKRTALINSLRFKINKESWPNNLKMTMPGRFFIQKFLAKALKEKCSYAILEVTSEGIKQFRHKFIDFDVAVLVNLQPEHLEAHGGSFEKYRQAKEKLFQALKKSRKKRLFFSNGSRGGFDTYFKKTAVVNLDQESAFYFLRHFAERKIGFSLEKKEAKNVDLLLVPEQYQLNSQGIDFVLEKVSFHSPLKGKFSLEDILAALATAKALDLPLNLIKEELEKFSGLPGRLEEIKAGQPFRIFVDFAHTPHSLEAVYQTLKENFLLPEKRLICILSATGGGRDRWKRPVMGKIAEIYCDEIIITNEDPYDENPRKIMEEIAKGLEKKSAQLIEDRREAIALGLKLAQEGDCLVITGKGAEQVMVLKNNQKIPWDDRVVVKEELEKLKNEKKNSF